MWSRVGAEEKFRAAAGRRIEQGFLMDVALENRQTEEMRANAANQHVVAVVEQVVGGDRRADVAVGRLDELHRVAGGDVFEHHLEAWEALGHPAQLLIDEVFFAIEDIDLRTRHFAVDQQRQTDFGHGFQHRKDIVDAGHPRRRIGGRTGRIQFGGMHVAAGFGCANVVGLRAIGEVEHHQRLELVFAGRAARIRWRYACASAALRTGGTRFGMMIARANWRAASATVCGNAAPSRR